MWVPFLQMLDALGISRTGASYMPAEGIQSLRRQHERNLERYAREDQVGPHASMAATSNPPRWEARLSLDSFGPDNEPLQITLPLDEHDPIGDVFAVIWEATYRLESFLFTLVRPEGNFNLLQYQAPLQESVDEMIPEDTEDHKKLLNTDARSLIDSMLNSDEMGTRINERTCIDLHMFCTTPPPPLVDEDQFAEMQITGENEPNDWLSGTIQAIYDNPDLSQENKEAMVAALFM